jgi:hypothetical protein
MQIVCTMLGAPRVGAPVVGVQGGSLPLEYVYTLLSYSSLCKIIIQLRLSLLFLFSLQSNIIFQYYNCSSLFHFSGQQCCVLLINTQQYI